jgi:hypothetical protein
MSMALATSGMLVAEADVNEPTVHEWLGRIHSSAAPLGVLHPKDPLVATVTAAAVDPLEIAAGLEASGMSRQVVHDQYGRPDVFALAHELWLEVPFRSVPIASKPVWRPGDTSDLMRGLLYAAPALMLLALTRALNLTFAWWSLPLAITWGWGLGQVAAHAGYTLRARSLAKAEAIVGGWLMVITILSTAVLGTAMAFWTGGGIASVLGAASVTTYMVASAVLLLHGEEKLAIRLVGPGAVATIVVLALGRSTISSIVALVCIGGSAAITVAAACRHLRVGAWRRQTLAPGDVRMTFSHLVHGIICGLALTLIAVLGGTVFAPGAGGRAAPALIVAMPLLATLGVMEWQLRTFRAGVEQLAASTHSLRSFCPISWAMFRRSLVKYTVTTTAMSAVAAVIIVAYGAEPPIVLLVVQVCLGAAFYTDLTVVSLARLDIALRSWTLGTAFGASVLGGCLAARGLAVTTCVWVAAATATVTAMISLFVGARPVVSAAMSH